MFMITIQYDKSKGGRLRGVDDWPLFFVLAVQRRELKIGSQHCVWWKNSETISELVGLKDGTVLTFFLSYEKKLLVVVN